MLSEYYCVVSDPHPSLNYSVSCMLRMKPLYQPETNFNAKVDYTVSSPQLLHYPPCGIRLAISYRFTHGRRIWPHSLVLMNAWSHLTFLGKKGLKVAMAMGNSVHRASFSLVALVGYCIRAHFELGQIRADSAICHKGLSHGRHLPKARLFLCHSDGCSSWSINWD